MNPPPENTESATPQAVDLRQGAEEVAAERAALSPLDPADLMPGKMRRTLHELEVHQIELEMQNKELRRAQAELDASRARYFDLYDLAPVGYCTLNEQGLILEANLTLGTLLGVVRGELIRRPISQFIHTEDEDVYCLYCQQLFATGEAPACELRMVKNDGAPLWVRLKSTTTHDAAGLPVLRVAFSDISELKQTEAAQRESERLLLEAQRIASLGSYVLHIPTGLWKSSAVLDQVFGIDEAYERSLDGWMALLHPDDRARMADYLTNEVIARHRDFDQEYRILRHDNQAERWIHGMGQLEFDAQGHPLTMHGTVQDITERKRVEEVQAFLAQTGHRTADQSFFNALARYLAKCLGMDFVCIDRLEGNGLSARTVAVWCDGHFEDNVTYALLDTPCGEVVGKTVCCFPANVCQLFPRDQVLKNLGRKVMSASRSGAIPASRSG